MFLLAEEQRADTASQSAMRRSLTKKEIIKSKAEIDRIFKHGHRYSCEGMRLLALSNGTSTDRLVVIPARGYGRAVDRNKLRRRCKEIFRTWDGRLDPEEHPDETTGLDLVLVVYPKRVSGFSLLESSFNSLLDRIHRK